MNPLSSILAKVNKASASIVTLTQSFGDYTVAKLESPDDGDVLDQLHRVGDIQFCRQCDRIRDDECGHNVGFKDEAGHTIS